VESLEIHSYLFQYGRKELASVIQNVSKCLRLIEIIS